MALVSLPRAAIELNFDSAVRATGCATVGYTTGLWPVGTRLFDMLKPRASRYSIADVSIFLGSWYCFVSYIGLGYLGRE